MKFTGFIEQGFFPREVFLTECRFEQGFLLRRDVPTHLFSNSCLSEAFRCNFRHSSTTRHNHVVANNNGWTIPPMGNKRCPRVGPVFLDFSQKTVHQSQSLKCVTSLEPLPTKRVSDGDSCPWFRRHVLQPTTMTDVDRTQASDLAAPAMPVRHFASHHGNLYPRPMTQWPGEYPDEFMRAFFAQFTMDATLRVSTKLSACDIFDVFLAAAFQIPPLRSTSPFCQGASDAGKYCRMP